MSQRWSGERRDYAGQESVRGRIGNIYEFRIYDFENVYGSMTQAGSTPGRVIRPQGDTKVKGLNPVTQNSQAHQKFWCS